MWLILLILPCALSSVVETYVTSFGCPGCDQWVSMIEEQKADFPNITFETVEFNFSSSEQVSLPYTKFDDKVYPYPLTSDYLHRWLSDISHGRSFDLVHNVSVHDHWYNGFKYWVHVLSDDYPNLEYHAKRLPSIGFAWTRMENHTFDNSVVYKDYTGSIFVRNDVTYIKDVLQRLLPPLIPFDEAESRAGRQILQYFDDSIYVVAPSVPAYNLPNVAFVHMTGEEDHAVRYNMTAPSAWLWKRNVEFMLSSVDVESVYRWYYGIQYGPVHPFQRLSLAKEGDLSGDEVWDWVRAREHAFIFEYASDETLSSCRAAVSDMTYDVGQLDMRTNDHESFPEWSRPGMIHYYRSGSYVGTRSCADAHTFLPKEEL